MNLEKLKFNISINAPREKVWEILWNDKTYREWTAVFNPGSHAISDNWREGTHVRFCDASGKNGMFALIEKNTPGVQMTFKHLGELKDGVEIPMNWGEGRESYFLSEQNGKTELRVELDSPGEFAAMFSDMFPKGLKIVKDLAEK